MVATPTLLLMSNCQISSNKLIVDFPDKQIVLWIPFPNPSGHYSHSIGSNSLQHLVISPQPIMPYHRPVSRMRNSPNLIHNAAYYYAMHGVICPPAS